jgi:hypothetical protein
LATGAVEDLSAELKNAYPAGTFEDPVNKEAPYRVSLNRVELVMRDGIAKFPLGVASAWNVGAIADIGTMPTPIDPTRRQGEVSPELFVGAFQIGVKTKVVGKNKVGTFNTGGIMADRVEGTVADLGKYINIVYAGSNKGRLGVVNANSGANTLVLSKPWGAGMLYKNMRIDVADALTGGNLRAATNRKLTTVNREVSAGPTALGEIVYDGANDATIVAGDHIFITSTYGRTHWTLSDIVDDGTDAVTIFGQSRVTDPELGAFVLRGSAGLRPLSEQLILEACSKPRRETGKRISRALSNDGQARKYVEFIQPERRYPGPTGEAPRYTTGYDEDSLQILAPGVNCKLEVDFDIAPRRIFFLCWETFGRYEAMALDWLDDDTLLKMIPTAGGHKAGFLAYVGAVENQINTMPRANSRLEDLLDPICGDGPNP